MTARYRLTHTTRLLCALFLLVCSSVWADIETVTTFPAEVPPGNIAIGPDGRIFISVHGFYNPAIKVAEVMADGSTRPYPNAQWASEQNATGVGLNGVLGLNVDQSGILWLLDGQTADKSGRLVAWNTNTEQLQRVIYLSPPVTRPDSFLNDLAVDTINQAVYISDPGGPETAALVVVDLTTGKARRVLEGSPFTRAESVDMVIEGELVRLGESPARVGVNPITIGPGSEWVYFGPMSGTSMYRVRTRDLLDESLTEIELRQRVERYGDKPISDGSTVDSEHNVYVTSVTDGSIGVIKPDGSYSTLYKNRSITWPDGFAAHANGYIYVTINRLHRSPVLAGREVPIEPGTFRLMRFPALANTVTGR